MTCQQTFDNFILTKRLADLSGKTISNYEQFIAPFIDFLGTDRDFECVTQEDIVAYISAMLTRPISKATRSTYIRHIKIFLRWAGSEYDVSYDAKKIKVPKSPKRQVRIYSDAEVSEIFQTISCESPWLTCRNRLIIALMYDSGLRQNEICTMKRAWISLDVRRLKVRGKGDKERTVPLGATSARLLEKYFMLCPFDSDYLFVSRHGEPLTCDAVKHMVTKLANQLPFELSSHKLRHNFATNYCIDQFTRNNQVDIYSLMYLMGHENIETTRRYLHFAMEIIASRETISHLDTIALCG